MKGASRKRALFFDKGVRAYRKFSGDPRSIYVCPICERGFDVGALDAGMLTLEHVPPKAIGGKPIALTCKDCNSRAGHTFDAALKTREDFRRFRQALVSRQGTYAGHVRLEAGGTQVNAKITVDASGLTLNVLSPINDPREAKRLFEHFEKLASEGAGIGEHYRITGVQRLRARHSTVGELRSAYLAAFARLGYEYAFHPRLAAVRQQIREPDRQLVNGSIRNEIEATEPRLVRLHKPFDALAVVFRVTTVILPWDTGPDDVYAELPAQSQPDQRITVSGNDLGWPSTMELTLDLNSD